jgi:hypothetical protein
MLLFRSEEHVHRWSRLWRVEPGATLTLEQAWGLEQAWFQDRRSPEWRRRTVDETHALFAELGLTSPFWRLQ